VGAIHGSCRPRWPGYGTQPRKPEVDTVPGQERILIVDDDPRVLLVLQATLERMDSNPAIVVARDGAEALARVKESAFDLIVSDVRMPGMNGIELVEAIRALEVKTPVVWITAYDSSSLEADRRRLAVYCSLDKPLTIATIRDAARKALGSHPDQQCGRNEDDR
jgi:CheY-like chemotaxis protein